MFTADTTGIKFGPFWMRPGLAKTNVVTIIFASFTTIAAIVFITLFQPYVLNEIVQIPAERQGQITGWLTTMQEFVVVLFVGFAGAWSDRIGRRPIFVLGFSLLAVGYVVYPMASNELELFLFRFVFALGVAFTPVMLSTTVQDSPQELSRGKWVGFMNICQGIGVLLLATVILGQLAPKFYAAQGFDAVGAGRMTLWSAGGLCVIAAIVLWAGLPRLKGKVGNQASLLQNFGAGLRAGWTNPRLAVAYGAAFIGRGDLVIIGNFMLLWITQYGIDQGMDTAEANGRAFQIFGIVQIAALGWAFFMGLIADRLNRVTALCIAMAIATVSYTAMSQVTDPHAGTMIPLALLLGMGEISVIVGGAALLGQEARDTMRGTIVGVFNLMGGVGIMMASGLGGILYDAMGRTSPFLMMGILNGTLFLAALLVRFRAGEPDLTGRTDVATETA